MLGRGVAWLDTGTHESLLQAPNYIQAIEERQGLMIACVEEVAYKMGFIDAEQVRDAAERMSKTEYGQYLLRMLDEDQRYARGAIRIAAERRPTLVIVATFVVLCLIWGTTWAVIQIGLRGIPPFSGVSRCVSPSPPACCWRWPS